MARIVILGAVVVWFAGTAVAGTLGLHLVAEATQRWAARRRAFGDGLPVARLATRGCARGPSLSLAPGPSVARPALIGAGLLVVAAIVVLGGLLVAADVVDEMTRVIAR